MTRERCRPPRLAVRAVLVLQALLLLPVLVSVGCGRTNRFDLGLRFEDGQGIEEGDPVVHDGDEIGEVVAVEQSAVRGVLVRIEIDEERRAEVHRESIFRIETSRSLLGSGEKARVVVKDVPGPVTPVASGEVLEGTETWAGELAARARGVGRAASRAASEIARDLGAELRELDQDLGATEKGRELLAQADELARQAGRLGVKTFEELRDEELPKLERKAREIKRELEASGKVEEARRFWESFRKWVDQELAAARERAAAGEDEPAAGAAADDDTL